MLVAGGIITLMYIPVFFTIRGNLLITPSQTKWYRYQIKFRSASTSITTDSTLSGGSSSRATHLRGVAKKMLWYPITYMALILPTVVCRFKGIYGSPVTLPVIVGCVSLFTAMGLTNVLIYVFTRNLGGTPWFARPLLNKQADVEIHIERTTFNEVGSGSGDNGRIQDNIENHPDIRLGGDLYPDIGVKGKEVVDGLPSPSSKVRTSSQSRSP